MVGYRSVSLVLEHLCLYRCFVVLIFFVFIILYLFCCIVAATVDVFYSYLQGAAKKVSSKIFFCSFLGYRSLAVSK